MSSSPPPPPPAAATMRAEQPAFALDPRLEADTLPVGNLTLCTVRLLNDVRFPWLVLVPQRPGLVELIDIAAGDRTLLTAEIDHAASVLKRVTSCDKLNVAALGNQVSQLHVHVIARFHTDDAWPAPVWGSGRTRRYDAAIGDTLAERLRTELGCA